MALRGYVWVKAAKRYRRIATGRYVSRADILKKLDRSINSRDIRIQGHVVAAMEGRISPNSFQAMEKLLLKRQALQSMALAVGGWDQMGPRQYGQVGALLRRQYGQLAALTEDIRNQEVTPAQALNRTHRYMGETRSLALTTERENQAPPRGGYVRIERRILDPAAAHCAQCPEYYAQGWQLAGTLPTPGQACDCDGNCRCTIQSRDVPADEVLQYVGRASKGGSPLASQVGGR